MLFVMFFLCAIGLIPAAVASKQKDQKGDKLWLQCLNCFAAGIFLSMSMVHVMPEASEIYSEWAKKSGIERPFPLPHVLYVAGYLLVLMVDGVIYAQIMACVGQSKPN